MSAYRAGESSMENVVAKRILMGASLCFGVGLALAACSGSSADVGVGDAGSGMDGTVGTGGPCMTDTDCASQLPATTPPNCAVGKCNALQGVCTFVAKDGDGDGHATASCKATSGSIQAGDDCDDNDPTLFPGHAESCSAKDDGTAITWPTGTPVGACHYGQKKCQTDGTVSACVGAKAPQARDCSSVLDNDCDGKPDNTADAVCSCTPGQTYACSSKVDGTPIVWPTGAWPAGTPAPASLCHKGTATCGADGRLETCGGAIPPAVRDCVSPNDNDCDGIVDNRDATCECASQPDGGGGGIVLGTTRQCGTHPGKDGIGVCHAGMQSCVVNPADTTKSMWNNPGCTDSVGPGTAICATADPTFDGDCDNQKDVNEYQSCGTKTGTTDGLYCMAQQCETMASTCGVIPGLKNYCLDLDNDGYCGSGTLPVNCATPIYDTTHKASSLGADACDVPGQTGHASLGQGCGAVGDCCPAAVGGVTLSCGAGTCKTCGNLGSSCAAGSTGCCAGTRCNGSSVCQTCGTTGGSCSVATDCCNGYTCISGSCQVGASCRAEGQSCTVLLKCCAAAGLTCQGGVCALF